MRLKQERISAAMSQSELAKRIKTDEPTLSKIENYKVLPIPEMLEKICKVLNCKISDIYMDKEIYVKKTNRNSEVIDCYKLCVRLEPEARNFLTKENLKACGYTSLTDWISKSYEELKEKFEILKKDCSNAATFKQSSGNKLTTYTTKSITKTVTKVKEIKYDR